MLLQTKKDITLMKTYRFTEKNETKFGKKPKQNVLHWKNGSETIQELTTQNSKREEEK